MNNSLRQNYRINNLIESYDQLYNDIIVQVVNGNDNNEDARERLRTQSSSLLKEFMTNELPNLPKSPTAFVDDIDDGDRVNKLSVRITNFLGNNMYKVIPVNTAPVRKENNNYGEGEPNKTVKVGVEKTVRINGNPRVGSIVQIPATMRDAGRTTRVFNWKERIGDIDLLESDSDADREELKKIYEPNVLNAYREYKVDHYLQPDGERSWTNKDDDIIPATYKQLNIFEGFYRFTSFAKAMFIEELEQQQQITRVEDEAIKTSLRSNKPTGGKGITRKAPQLSIFSGANLLLQVITDITNSRNFKSLIKPKLIANAMTNRERDGTAENPLLTTVLQFREMKMDFIVYQCIIRYLLFKFNELQSFFPFASGEKFYSQEYFLDLFDGDNLHMLLSQNGRPLKEDSDFVIETMENHIRTAYPSSEVVLLFLNQMQDDIFDYDSELMRTEFVDGDRALAGYIQERGEFVSVRDGDDNVVTDVTPRPPPPTRGQSRRQPQRRSGKRTRDNDEDEDDDDEIKNRSREAIRSTRSRRLLEF